eukprot:gene10578-7347_t
MSCTRTAAVQRVMVTGLGAVTPIGTSVASTWAALCACESGCSSLARAPYFLPDAIASDRRLSNAEKELCLTKLVDKMPCRVAAPVMATHDATGRHSFAPTAHLPRSCQFAAAAVEEALTDAGLLLQGHQAKQQRGLAVEDLDRVGVNIGVGIPSVADVGDASHALFAGVAGSSGAVHYNKVHPFFVSKILGNTPTAATSIHYGITGPTSSSVAACATGAYCIGEAAGWIRTGRADVVVCGSTEACITPVAMAGFARMRALSTAYNETPAVASRPFDRRRAGFVMGEGAGIMVLESAAHAVRRGAKRIYAELRGFGLSSDAHHVAAPDPAGRGAARCVAEALRDGGDLPASGVGYVNAHATGTIGDPIELGALQRALRPAGSCDGQPLWVSSSKGAMGHLLGAAGSVEAIIAVLALHHNVAPPNVHLDEPCWTAAEQESNAVRLVPPTVGGMSSQTAGGAPWSAVLSTSFGFGGMNSALLFSHDAPQQITILYLSLLTLVIYTARHPLVFMGMSPISFTLLQKKPPSPLFHHGGGRYYHFAVYRSYLLVYMIYLFLTVLSLFFHWVTSHPYNPVDWKVHSRLITYYSFFLRYVPASTMRWALLLRRPTPSVSGGSLHRHSSRVIGYEVPSFKDYPYHAQEVLQLYRSFLRLIAHFHRPEEQRDLLFRLRQEFSSRRHLRGHRMIAAAVRRGQGVLDFQTQMLGAKGNKRNGVARRDRGAATVDGAWAQLQLLSGNVVPGLRHFACSPSIQGGSYHSQACTSSVYGRRDF